MPEEAISIRTKRLNNFIVGQQTGSIENTLLPVILSREFLLDALLVLYNQCDKDNLKKKDKNVYDFIVKYRDAIADTKYLRVNSSDFIQKALIGNGRFGEVRLVKEKVTGDIYAMKKIEKTLVKEFQLKEERNIMSLRCSEWITNLQYSFQDVDYLYLIMEYLPGGDLLSLMIRNGPFEEEIVKFYLAEISVALNDLHHLGYVHRDIKPENILIDLMGHIKLADFGNAVAIEKNGSVISLSPVGTPYYIAPELLESVSPKTFHDVTCDFWSMGIIGYEMMFEITPFQSDNVQETYSQISSFSETNRENAVLTFPNDVNVSENFKNLLRSLVVKPSKRLNFCKLKKHIFFENIQWDSVRHQVPPFIPTVKHDEDISNFENVEKIRGKRNTFITRNVRSFNEFSGNDLPFIGYGFVNETNINIQGECSCENNDFEVKRLTNKIKDMQIIINNQNEEIKCIQERLLNAEKRVKQCESTGRILTEAKEEIMNMKEKLKMKTIEIAQIKTEKKTLQNALKKQEEDRVKTDKSLSEILGATYKKWEASKTASDQNYEKKIAEQTSEIISLTQKLNSREHELAVKSEELDASRKQIEYFKELLHLTRNQAASDRREFEKIKLGTEEAYEIKLTEMQRKLKDENDCKKRLTIELQDVRSELDESKQSSNNYMQVKKTTEKTYNEIKERLNREIEANNILRTENNKITKLKSEVEKAYESMKIEHEKLKREIQLHEAMKKLNLESGASSQYQSAHGSLTELYKVEEQLRIDLAQAKDEEDRQRSRANQLKEVVKKLEGMISKMGEQPRAIENVLEKQNEKLEDKLTAVHEQMIVERQSARVANYSLWKVEKQLEELKTEKQKLQRRFDVNEEKIKHFQNEKSNSDLHIKELENEIKFKDNRIKELKDEIKILKVDIQKEHQAWEKAEKERIQEKSDVLKHINHVHKMEERVQELNQKLLQTQSKQDLLTLENKRLLREMDSEKSTASANFEQLSELQIKLKSSREQYDAMKSACLLNDQLLTEFEKRLKNEMEKNKSYQQKVDNLFKNVYEKEEVISQLKKDLNLETSNRLEAERKIKILTTEIDECRKNLEHVNNQLISQQKQLFEKTNDLFGTQEKLELISIESNNAQMMIENFEKEINILKEENAKILTELFHTKEERNNLYQKLKLYDQNLNSLQHELQHLNETFKEQKNFYMQREIKSEATISQHKKLIDYLQLKIEDLSQKKKKSFADKIFGNTTTKENICPNNVESSILYRTLQEELNREKQKNKVLQDKLNKYTKAVESPNLIQDDDKVESISSSASKEKYKSFTQKVNEVELLSTIPPVEKSVTIPSTNTTYYNLEKSNDQPMQSHRFELNLESNEARRVTCFVCQLPIMSGSPYWFCKECKSSVHCKCRGNVKISCGNSEQDFSNKCDQDNDKYTERETIGSSKIYNGDFILSADILNPPLQINCVYDLSDEAVLLGTTIGLFAYGLKTHDIVQISGIDNVQYISATTALSKMLLIAKNGKELYQCDLRQVQSRSQSKALATPELQIIQIDTPHVKYEDKYKLIKISKRSVSSSIHAIAVGSRHMVIMKYTDNLQQFTLIHCLEVSVNVTSILFTRHTAILSAEKLFEVDLNTYTIEEFIDFSDPTLNHFQNYQALNIFNVSQQEYLVCFAECGIFVDEYGCRSRPYELTWEYTPTAFLYQEPFLYVSHFQLVQIIRLHRSYQNDIEGRQEIDGSKEVPNWKRIFMNIHMATLMGPRGNNNCYCLSVNRSHGVQQLLELDGLKCLKVNQNMSTETLSSIATCLTSKSESSCNS